MRYFEKKFIYYYQEIYIYQVGTAYSALQIQFVKCGVTLSHHPETITEKLMKCQLEWLRYLAGVVEVFVKNDHRTPKRTLFGLLPQKHPPGGPQKRWRVS